MADITFEQALEQLKSVTTSAYVLDILKSIKNLENIHIGSRVQLHQRSIWASDTVPAFTKGTVTRVGAGYFEVQFDGRKTSYACDMHDLVFPWNYLWIEEK